MTTIKQTLIALAVVFAGISGTNSGAAFAQTTNHMATGGITSQPIGHAYFCQQFPQECQVKSRRTSAPKLTKKRWSDLVSVNNSANQSVEPITDQDYYGVEEHWTYPKDFGDCEDYALLKRYMLLQRGWPESSLLITVVKQPNGDGHAVLTVRTDRADYILDNLETKVTRWNKTPYKYLKRQSTNHTGKWTSIKDSRAKVASY